MYILELSNVFPLYFLKFLHVNDSKNIMYIYKLRTNNIKCISKLSELLHLFFLSIRSWIIADPDYFLIVRQFFSFTLEKKFKFTLLLTFAYT